MKAANTYGILILAGGKSGRMSYPKPWLSLNDGSTFLEHIVDLYVGLNFKNIVVVLNHDFYSDKWSKQLYKIEKYCLIVKNTQVENGRLFSIKSGLKKLINSNYVFIQNTDSPFINEEVIDALQNHCFPDSVIIPTYKNKGGHPVLISKIIAEHIIRNYDSYKTLHDVFDKFKRKYVEVKSEKILLNLNTPSEYKKVMCEFT